MRLLLTGRKRDTYEIDPSNRQKISLDTSGIEPDTSRMLSERDKPTTPCALQKFAGMISEKDMYHPHKASGVQVPFSVSYSNL